MYLYCFTYSSSDVMWGQVGEYSLLHSILLHKHTTCYFSTSTADGHLSFFLTGLWTMLIWTCLCIPFSALLLELRGTEFADRHPATMPLPEIQKFAHTRPDPLNAWTKPLKAAVVTGQEQGEKGRQRRNVRGSPGHQEKEQLPGSQWVCRWCDCMSTKNPSPSCMLCCPMVFTCKTQIQKYNY